MLNWRSKAVIVDRGACAFTTKVFNAQSLGASVVVIADVYKAPKEPFRMSRGTHDPVKIPSCSLTFHDAERLKRLLSQSDRASVKLGVTTGRIAIEGGLDIASQRLSSSNLLEISFKSPPGWRVDVELVDESNPSTRILLATNVESSSSIDKPQMLQLPLHDVPPGTYFLRLSLPGIEITRDEAKFPLVVEEENVTSTGIQTNRPSTAPTVASGGSPVGQPVSRMSVASVVGIVSGVCCTLIVSACCCAWALKRKRPRNEHTKLRSTSPTGGELDRFELLMQESWS